MKIVHRLSILLLVMLVALPLAILAQDNPNPPPPLSDDELLPPLPLSDDELLPPPPLSDDELLPPLPSNDDDLIVPIPPLDTCGNDDPSTVFIPLCPPTVTPVPRPTLDTTSIINGMWVLDPNESGYNKMGDCQVPGGDNDGPSGQDEPLENLPRVPICMTGDLQWLTVDSGSAYPLVLPKLYSQQEMSRELVTTDGATSGTVNVTTNRQYRVISPTVIEFAFMRQEDGGCSTESTVRYKLMEPNELVCTSMMITPVVTATFTPIPTAKPDETSLPPVTPEPPLKEGRYVIQVPTDDASCPADALPQGNTVDVSYDNDQNMFINFGGGSYTLYWDGGEYYEYQKDNQFSISMVTYEGGAYLAWSKQGCYVGGDLAAEGAPMPTPVPIEPTNEAEITAASVAGSTYSTALDIPEYLCTAENKALLPDLSSAVLTAQVDDTFSLSFDGADYVLTNYDGYYVFTQFGDDGSMLTVSMNGFYEGVGSGNFGVVTADGKQCFAQIFFNPLS